MAEEDLSVGGEEEPLFVQVPSSAGRRLRLRLSLSFWLFGLINNVLYVIILSAALDLVPPNTPKGIVAFANIAPALVAKVGWPYLLKGRIRYQRRLWGYTLLSVFGMVMVAAFESLTMRLLGIAFASFCSGLGELTWLQLSTSYGVSGESGRALGYFASGTGAAGLVGAGLWWIVRGLGVKEGVGLSSILPFTLPLTYYFLLPLPADFAGTAPPQEDAQDPQDYSALPTSDPLEVSGVMADGLETKVVTVALSAADKLAIVKPLLLKYMLPLFCVYTFEYTINQGIGPTLVYPVPTAAEHPVLSHIISSVRDYYPLWQLVYQTFVFLSRSSLSLGIPALPARLLPLPSAVQLLILLTLVYESYHGILSTSPSSTSSIPMVFLLIGLEGICGGLAYVNVFYHVSQEKGRDDADLERSKQEREFKIGSIGFADTLGILLASVIAIPTEVGLCNAQARRGKVIYPKRNGVVYKISLVHNDRDYWTGIDDENLPLLRGRRKESQPSRLPDLGHFMDPSTPLSQYIDYTQ